MTLSFRSVSSWWLVPLVLGMTACSLAPDYERPAAPVPAAWPTGGVYPAVSAETQAQAQAQEVSGWKSYFTSPVMQRLIQTALDNNRDLRVAALNVEVARAAYQVQEADLFPTLTGDTGYSRQRTPATASSTGKAISSRQFSASVGVTAFELDLFGKVRSQNESALQSFFATQEARSAAQISLIAEVANAYLQLLADRKLLSLTEETLVAQEKSYGLIERSFANGIGSQLDVSQARTSVETARANLALYQRQAAQDMNALSVLLGVPVSEEMVAGETLEHVQFAADLPVGVPSSVLLRRPDILQAEHQLQSANANIGAARAAFFPSISLTGSFGTASTALSALFSGGSAAWAFAPSASMPLFDMGRTQANLDSAKASRDVAVASYEKSIQTAFREVADALAAQGTLGTQLTAQQSLVEATQTSYTLSTARYLRGIDSYLNVLDAQRSLYSAQQQAISVEREKLANAVTLYKVLGGGKD